VYREKENYFTRKISIERQSNLFSQSSSHGYKFDERIMIMNSPEKTKQNLKKVMLYTFWGLVAGVLLIAALLLTHPILIPSASAAATSPKSLGRLGAGYSLVTGADGTRIIYPYQVNLYASGVATSPKSIGALGSGYSLVTDANGRRIVYPYQVKLYPSTLVTSPKSLGLLGSGYSLVADANGTHIIYPYQVKLYDQTPKADSTEVK
jgi:hypothetical protein